MTIKNIIIIKRLIAILCTILIAFSLVGGLAWSSLRKININNGFKRLVLSKEIVPIKVIPRDNNINDIAGIENDLIYFKTNDQNKVLIFDLNLSIKDEILNDISQKEKFVNGYNCYINFSKVYIISKQVPLLLLNDYKLHHSQVINLPVSTITRSVVISDSSIVVRSFDTTKSKIDQIFIKVNPFSKHYKIENGISEKNNDAGISTDGSLNYDYETNKIIYVHYYSNKFICMDTNLNLVYVAHTIDTIAKSQAQGDLIQNNLQSMEYTNLLPKRLINSRSCVWKGKLYVCSNMRADNEELQRFHKESVIDIYEISNSNYLGSIYIPNLKDEKLRQFKIFNNRLLAMYPHYIGIYPIRY